MVETTPVSVSETHIILGFKSLPPTYRTYSHVVELSILLHVSYILYYTVKTTDQVVIVCLVQIT